MRSQKQNNRAPRPFKNSSSGGRWSGGQGSGGYIPAPKIIQRAIKPQSPPRPEPPP